MWYDPRFKSKKAQEEEDEKRATMSGRPLSTLDSGPLAQHTLQSGSNTPPGTLIRDVMPVVVSGMDEFLVTLSDKELGMYRWSESQPLGGEEGSDDDDGSEEEEDEVEEPMHVRSKGKRRRLDGDGDDDDVVIVDNGGAGGSGRVEQGASSTASSPMFNTQ